MEKKYTFKTRGLEIKGTKEMLEELVSCINYEDTEPSNALADIVSEIETIFDLK